MEGCWLNGPVISTFNIALLHSSDSSEVAGRAATRKRSRTSGQASHAQPVQAAVAAAHAPHGYNGTLKVGCAPVWLFRTPSAFTAVLLME